MNWSAIHPYDAGTYKQTCDYCGTVFEVQVQKQDGHNEREEYYCPSCNKEFGVRACNTPRVNKISDRTDGRTDLYPNK